MPSPNSNPKHTPNPDPACGIDADVPLALRWAMVGVFLMFAAMVVAAIGYPLGWFS